MINRKSGTVFRDLAPANQGGAQGHRSYYGVACTEYRRYGSEISVANFDAI